MTAASGLANPKPERRKKAKDREDRIEAARIKGQREETVERDGPRCRLLSGDAETQRKLHEMFGLCKGDGQWSHYNRTHRRSKTMGMPIEDRHDRRHALMLCAYHSAEYDENRMDIEELTPEGCDGPLKISRGPLVWIEE